MLFWNASITAVFESFAVVIPSALIWLKYSAELSSSGLRVQTAICSGFFGIYFVLPVIALAVVGAKWSKVRDKAFTETLGSLYENLALDKGRKVLLQPIYFLLRRLHFPILVIYFTQ